MFRRILPRNVQRSPWHACISLQSFPKFRGISQWRGKYLGKPLISLEKSAKFRWTIRMVHSANGLCYEYDKSI